jgi:hypothetical protein
MAQAARVQPVTQRDLPHPPDFPARCGAKREWETGPEGRIREHSPSDRVDGTADRAGCRSCNGSEECSVGKAEYRYNQCPVQVVILHFAGGLGDQRAAVTGSTVEPAALQTLTSHVVGADRTVRTERAHPTLNKETALICALLKTSNRLNVTRIRCDEHSREPRMRFISRLVTLAQVLTARPQRKVEDLASSAWRSG